MQLCISGEMELVFIIVAYIKRILGNLTVNEFCKSVHICQSYNETSSFLFFTHDVFLPAAPSRR